jgi:hypothetical protein
MAKAADISSKRLNSLAPELWVQWVSVQFNKQLNKQFVTNP